MGSRGTACAPGWTANEAAMISPLLDTGVYEPQLTRVAMLERHSSIVEVNASRRR